MVILDVVIIGGGPHALTLASLLSNPGHELSLSSTCMAPKGPGSNRDPSKTKHSGGKKKRRRAAGTSLEELLAKPEISERIVSPQLSLRVVDSYGEWTTLWESQFSSLNIPHLRSHTLVHTDPFNKEALQEFVSKHDRARELHSLPDRVYILDENAFFNDMRLGKKERRRLHITSTLRKSLPFSLPGTKLSVDFFKDQVKQRQP